MAASDHRSPPRRKALMYAGDMIVEIEPRYRFLSSIGKGAYGVVGSAEDRKERQLVCLKHIHSVFSSRTVSKRILRELKLLRLFNHDNIVVLERVMRPFDKTFESLTLVMELMETDLTTVIRSDQELTMEHVQFFMYQVLRALKYMHSVNVAHRDLKPRNILVNSNCDVKLCDFGLARLDDPAISDKGNISSYVQSRWYRAPEVLLEDEYDGKAIDMWSCGCVMAEIINRRPLFPGDDPFDQLRLIVETLGPAVPKDIQISPRAKQDLHAFIAGLPQITPKDLSSQLPTADPVALDLLRRFLTLDPASRITVNEAIKHPFFANLHDPTDEPICKIKGFREEFAFDFDPSMNRAKLRELIFEEIVKHYPLDKCPCEEQFKMPLLSAAKQQENTPLARFLSDPLMDPQLITEIVSFLPCWCGGFVHQDNPEPSIGDRQRDYFGTRRRTHSF